MKPRMDDVDQWCSVWAYQWASMFLRDPRRARDYIGPLCCTLGRVHELHDGAASQTEHDRHFPEGFLGDGLVVAVAIKYLSSTHQDWLRHHYIVRVYSPDTGRAYRYPIPVPTMASRMGLDIGAYSRRRDAAKSMIRSAFLGGEEKVAYGPHREYFSASVG
jgi:hypothetical protein